MFIEGPDDGNGDKDDQDQPFYLKDKFRRLETWAEKRTK
jgi:hypothetical protein